MCSNTFLAFLSLTFALPAAERPLVFPAPQTISVTGSDFLLTESVPIVTPDPPGPPIWRWRGNWRRNRATAMELLSGSCGFRRFRRGRSF